MEDANGKIMEAERLLSDLEDDEVAARTGLSLEQILELRAIRAASPLPRPATRRGTGRK